MAYDIVLTGKNKEQAHFLLEKVTTVLEQINVSYWLDGGTLLGVIREDRLLPWDDDIDLSVHFTNQNEISKIIKSLKKVGLRVRPKRIEVSDEHFSKGDVRVIKIRKNYLWGLFKGKVCLEIFIRYKIKEQTYARIGDQNQVIPFKFCSKLKSILFRGKNYTIPELTNEYLTIKYGDWKIQKKEWSVFTDDKSMQ